MYKCIYCCEEIKIDPNKRNPVEHVIPKMLGKFKLNLTLKKEVCSECNSYFSKGIELSFGRDSVYGILYRPLVGLLKAEDFDKSICTKRKNLQITDYHPKYGQTLVNITLESEKNFTVRLADQFFIFNSTKGLKVLYPMNELPHRGILDSIGLPTYNSNIIFFGAAINPNKLEEKHHLIQEKLNRADIKCGRSQQEINVLTSLSKDSPLIFRSCINDDEMIRVIAKIGFNYFTCFFGAKCALSNCFDEIRKYIRYGEKTNHILVIWDKQLINMNVTDFKKGNFTTHKVSMFMDQNIIKVIITLFNKDRFEVILTQKYPILLQPRAHRFDLLSRTITELDFRL